MRRRRWVAIPIADRGRSEDQRRDDTGQRNSHKDEGGQYGHTFMVIKTGAGHK